jgi:hypothetical protein
VCSCRSGRSECLNLTRIGGDNGLSATPYRGITSLFKLKGFELSKPYPIPTVAIGNDVNISKNGHRCERPRADCGATSRHVLTLPGMPASSRLLYQITATSFFPHALLRQSSSPSASIRCDQSVIYHSVEHRVDLARRPCGAPTPL